MLNKVNIKAIAVNVVNLEADAIKNLADTIDDQFYSAVKTILNCKGRIIVTGIGKSAIIGTKIVATLNSTGTPAIFMHAGDALHGDLGIIQENDIVLCISKSGNSPEIKLLLPLIKNLGTKIIALVSSKESYLATKADIVLFAPVEKEACPNNLAPTSSTTVQLVMGDALAICLLESRGFTKSDYARFHPGGAIGKKLYMRVSDFISPGKIPAVKFDDDISKIIFEISSNRLGSTAVIDQNGSIAGIITDGDLRRMLEKAMDIQKITASDIMSVNPKTIESESMAIDAFELMKNFNITQLLITTNGKYSGIIHLHDILKEGVI